MRPIPFQQFFDTILLVYAPAHATRTVAKMRRVLGLVGALQNVNTTADLTTEMAARFVAARAATVTANTVRGDLSYLAAACAFAVEEGWLERVPRFRRVRPRPSPIRAPRVHTIQQMGRVLELLESRSETWSGHRLYALAATSAHTGLRRDELLHLKVEDIDLATGLLAIIPRRRLKTLASAAAVPIPPDLGKILAAWLPRCGSEWVFPGMRKRDRPWTGGMNGARPCDRIREAGRECGVEGLTIQSMRHTFATHARRTWGLSGLQTMDVLRHTSPRTTELYVHDDPDPGAIVRAVRSVSFRE